MYYVYYICNYKYKDVIFDIICNNNFNIYNTVSNMKEAIDDFEDCIENIESSTY